MRVVLNWCYGADEPTQNVDIVNEQLWLAHVYKNRLIEIERTRRQAAELAARSLSPEFEAAAAATALAKQAAEAAYAAVKASRVLARRRVDPTEEQQAAINAAKARVAAAVAAEKVHKSAAYARLKAAQKVHKDAATAQIVPMARETAGAVKKRITALYFELLTAAGVIAAGEPVYAAERKAARRDSGLYWGTYLIIERAAKDYRKGAPPKFRRFNGNGAIAVQLQGGLTVAEAVAGTDTQLRLYLPELTERLAMTGSDKGRQAVGEAWLRIGSVGPEGRQQLPVWCRFPFTYHREIPADSVIKWAFLDRRRVGLTYTWRLRLAMEMTRPAVPVATPDRIAVHMGYRMTFGGLRIASVITPNGVQELVMPRSEVEAFKVGAELESLRDNITNAALSELVPWVDALEASPAAEWFLEQTQTLVHWKNPERLNRLITNWRSHRFPEDCGTSAVFPNLLSWARVKLAEYQDKPYYRPAHPDDLSTVFGLFDFWRKFDKHLCEWIANESRKCSLRREGFFRNFAQQLSTTYASIVLADVDWRELRRTPAVDEQEVVHTRGRRIADIAAPGRLTEILTEAFSKPMQGHSSSDISRLTWVDAANITRLCSHCGELNDFDRKQTLVTCEACGAVWDQDHNAGRNTLARAGVTEPSDVENAADSAASID